MTGAADVAKSAVAAVAYTVALPFAWLAGEHGFYDGPRQAVHRHPGHRRPVRPHLAGQATWECSIEQLN